MRDFSPITRVAQVPNVLVMNADTANRLGISSVTSLVAYAKRFPGRLNYGSGGNGSAGHLAGGMFKAQAGVFMVHIPYAGGNTAQLGACRALGRACVNPKGRGDFRCQPSLPARCGTQPHASPAPSLTVL